jgi:hypothetical protein
LLQGVLDGDLAATLRERSRDGEREYLLGGRQGGRRGESRERGERGKRLGMAADSGESTAAATMVVVAAASAGGALETTVFDTGAVLAFRLAAKARCSAATAAWMRSAMEAPSRPRVSGRAVTC